MKLKRLLLGRRENGARRWVPAAIGLFAFSTVLLGGLVSLFANAPATAEMWFEPIVGAVMVVTMFVIIAQALSDGGLLVAVGLASVPVFGCALATELLVAGGAVVFDAPFAERVEIYGLLVVFGLVAGAFAFLVGIGLARIARTTPADSWFWRAGTRAPAEEYDGNRIDAWLGSLGPLGFSLVIVAVAVAAAVGYGFVELWVGVEEVSFVRLVGAGLGNALMLIVMIFLLKSQRPEPQSG